MYTYTAKAIKVIDGDTVKLEVDPGFRLRFTDNFRLEGINAPELNQEGGLASKKYLEELLFDKIATSPNSLFEGNVTLVPKELYIRTSKPEKYGRWLVTIWTGDTDDSQDLSVNQNMIDQGHATEYLTK